MTERLHSNESNDLQSTIHVFIQIADAIRKHGNETRSSALARYTPLYRKVMKAGVLDPNNPQWKAFADQVENLDAETASRVLLESMPAPRLKDKILTKIKGEYNEPLIDKNFGTIGIELENHVATLHFELEGEGGLKSLDLLSRVHRDIASALIWIQESHPEITVVYARSWLLSLPQKYVGKVLPEGGFEKKIDGLDSLQRRELWGQLFGIHGVKQDLVEKIVQDVETQGPDALLESFPYPVRAKSWDIRDFFGMYRIKD